MIQEFIVEYPGYYWEWTEPLSRWILKWSPLENTYSPPVFDTSLEWYHVSIPEHIKNINILRFPNDKKRVYMYFRHDLNKIEIWSHDLGASVIKVIEFLNSIKKNEKTLKHSKM